MRRTTAFAAPASDVEVIEAELPAILSPKPPKTPAHAGTPKSPLSKHEAPSLKEQEEEILLQGKRDSAIEAALSTLEVSAATAVPRWAKVPSSAPSLLSLCFSLRHGL